jgi:membrane protein implicated in regulation of membrane protease activity
MEHILNYWIWLGAGVFLILLEFFLPGLVVVFLGVGAVITAGMLYTRYLLDPYHTIIFFSVSSVFLLATLRRIMLRFYPAVTEKVETDENVLIAGQPAETITIVYPDHFDGRVKYSGTTWPAKSENGIIPAGSQVVIIGRQNINLVVRKI